MLIASGSYLLYNNISKLQSLYSYSIFLKLLYAGYLQICTIDESLEYFSGHECNICNIGYWYKEPYGLSSVALVKWSNLSGSGMAMRGQSI